jgi:PilZ domain
MNPKDKRRAARRRHDSVMEIYDSSGHFIMGTGHLVNFSNVGVCISSTRVLQIGAALRARLRLLREGTLEVSAHVVWARQKPNTTLYGLAFDAVEKLQD